MNNKILVGVITAVVGLGTGIIIKNKRKFKEMKDWNEFKKRENNIKVDEIILD